MLLPMTALFASTDSVFKTASHYLIFWVAIILGICYARRNKAIGGWLLFYFIQLYSSFFLAVSIIVANSSKYIQSSWASPKQYFLYLWRTIPIDIMTISLIILSFWMIPRGKRNWKIIKILKLVLSLEIIFLITTNIGTIYWRQRQWRLSFILTLIWLLVWLSYFAFSKRIKSVYLTKNWEELCELKKHTTAQQQSRPPTP